MDVGLAPEHSAIILNPSCTSGDTQYVPSTSTYYCQETSALVSETFHFCREPAVDLSCYEPLKRTESNITREEEFYCSPLLADSYGSVSHNCDIRSEVTASRPESTLPFKKRKLTHTLPAKGVTNEVGDMHSEPIINSPFDPYCSYHYNYPECSYAEEEFSILQNSFEVSTYKKISCMTRTCVQTWVHNVLSKTEFGLSSEMNQLLEKLEKYNGPDILNLSLQDWNSLSEPCGTILFNAIHRGESFDWDRNKTRERRKRIRRKGDQCVGQLWEFIFKMLQSRETNPSVICWEDEDKGLFRIVDTEKLAHLWGKRKGKPDMTYAHMSRTMRNYRNGKGAFIPDDRKRVYGFGPRADIQKLRRQELT